jgi:hypothetical protein
LSQNDQKNDFGALEGARVVVVLEGFVVAVISFAEQREDVEVEGLRDVARRSDLVVESPEHELRRVEDLDARRRPIFIWPSSMAVSVPGRPEAAQ